MKPQLSSIAAILLSTLIFLVGNGLLGTLIPVRAHLEGFSTLAIGVIGSAYFAGFVLGCFTGPRWLARVGHIRTFAVCAGIAAAATLLQSMLVGVFAWIAMRALFGFAAANMYMVLESWLNDRAGNESRGRIFAAYLSVNFGGLLIGQLLFATSRPQSFMLFSLATIFYALCLIPVGLTQSPQPARADTGLATASPVPHLAGRRRRLHRRGARQQRDLDTGAGLCPEPRALQRLDRAVHVRFYDRRHLGAGAGGPAFRPYGPALRHRRDLRLGRRRRHRHRAVHGERAGPDAAVDLRLRRSDAAALRPVDGPCQRPHPARKLRGGLGDAAADQFAGLGARTAVRGKFMHSRARTGLGSILVLLWMGERRVVCRFGRWSCG